MLIKTDPAVIKSHLEDSSNLQGGYADGLYLPENEQEISEALSEGNDKKIPLTIAGGETGTTGGCIPFGGWLLSTEKLNKIIDINTEERFAIVQPGVTLEALEAAVSKAGLLYAPDPTEKTATLGGNVATNASGGRCYRFGATRRHIRRLRVVLPSGISLNLKRGLFFANKRNEFPLPHLTFPIPNYTMPTVKSSAGYFSQSGMDLVDLFIGQEGTLGIISEIEVGLVPALNETFDLIAFFPQEANAVDFVLEAKSQKDPLVNFFEFFDANTLQMLKASYPHIPEGAKAAIYIEQEITAENEKGYLDAWAVLLEKYQVSLDNCWLGMDPAQKEELANFRHAIPEHINDLFKKHQMVKLASDIAVPTAHCKEMYAFYAEEIKKTAPDIFHIKFGHIGDDHLHVNLLPKNESELLVAKDLIMRFVLKSISLGGTVSAEHGIGKIKHPYLKALYQKEGINEMIRVKKVFDPNFILGKNNLFPSPDATTRL